jgi:hypothetical protein
VDPPVWGGLLQSRAGKNMSRILATLTDAEYEKTDVGAALLRGSDAVYGVYGPAGTATAKPVTGFVAVAPYYPLLQVIRNVSPRPVVRLESSRRRARQSRSGIWSRGSSKRIERAARGVRRMKPPRSSSSSGITQNRPNEIV